MFDKFGGVTRRNFVKGGVAAGALAGLAACSSSNGSSTSTTASNSSSTYTGGSVSYYINDPVAIDPYNCQESEGTQVVKCLFDPLTKYDWENQELLPAAAESWEANDDASEFTFHLVKGAKFHNGDPVTAECFKRGWERMCDSTMTT
ncbi:MAG: ABC transporter substrate-binding protein, partial [Olsenella sp.]